jgi:DNA replication and repair protein RecF
LVGRVSRGKSNQSIEITLTQQPDNGTRYRKQIRINGVNRRAMDLLGHLNVVLFLPQDIELVSGSPSGRRRYLDVTLCQVDPVYCRHLSRYNQIVTQRNALLRDLRERSGNPGQLAFWDEKLSSHGAYLIHRRQGAVDVLDRLAHSVHMDLTDGEERLQLRYEPSLETEEKETVDVLQQAFLAQLAAQRQREIGAGMSLTGPHRDEMRFLIDGVDAGVYGSRGQQRTAALALKLAEVDLMHRETGEHPVLLLDDVLSELDGHRRSFLMRALEEGPQQSVITTTELHALPESFLQRCQLFRVRLGQLTEAQEGNRDPSPA